MEHKVFGEEDARTLEMMYRSGEPMRTAGQDLNVERTLEDFLYFVAHRMCIEYCGSPEGRAVRFPQLRKTEKAVWESFRDQEVHLALERMHRNVGGGGEHSHEVYLGVRRQVVTAIGERAKMLFDQWGTPHVEKETDSTNLRASIKPHLHDPMLV